MIAKTTEEICQIYTKQLDKNKLRKKLWLPLEETKKIILSKLTILQAQNPSSKLVKRCREIIEEEMKL